mgnify:CR=1 FL=1
MHSNSWGYPVTAYIQRSPQKRSISNPFLKTSLIISIINKATDSNKKNDIKIGEDGNYIDNGKNSIRIEIKFLELDKVITMERINNVGIEKFWSNYGALSFKCTKIEYHEKTHRVKYMYFEEV